MRKRLIRLFLIASCLILASCSSQESRENFDTLLCWLRPSCLPSHQSSSSRRPTRRVSKPSPSRQVARTPTAPPCHTTLKTTIRADRPTIKISYVEPATKTNGSPLDNLVKTTIYRDDGKGYKKTKDVPATNPKGGGMITETLSFSVAPGKTLETTICVTATNSFGQEG